MMERLAQIGSDLDLAGQYDLADRIDAMSREAQLGKLLSLPVRAFGGALRGTGKALGLMGKHPYATLGLGAAALGGANYLRNQAVGQEPAPTGRPRMPMGPPITPSLPPPYRNVGEVNNPSTSETSPVIQNQRPLSEMQGSLPSGQPFTPTIGDQSTFNEALDMVRGGTRGGTPSLDQVNEARSLAQMPPIGQAEYQTMYPPNQLR